MFVVSADAALLVKRAYYEPDGSVLLNSNDGKRVVVGEVILESVVVDVLRRRQPERRLRPPSG